MDRQKKVLRNLLIIAILLPLALNRSGLYLTPLSAHEHSERSIHYGPSRIVHIQDFEEGKYFLCKYDKWFSCNTVNRQLFFFWRFGNQVSGMENDITKPVSYTWNGTNRYFKVYGIVNDDRITKIEVTFRDGTILSQTDFYDDMFLLTWTTEKQKDKYMSNIKGYDSNNIVLYEDTISISPVGVSQ